MEAPIFPDVHFQNPAETAIRHNAKAAKYEVVEISSDEDGEDDVVDGQPESSARTSWVSPTNKRTVIIDNDDESPDEAFDVYHYVSEPVRGKRQKLEHADELENAKVKIDADQFMDWSPIHQPQPTIRAPLPQHVAAEMALDGLYNDDGDATFEYKPSDFLQGANHTPKAKKLRQNRSEFVPIEVELNKSKVRLETPPYYYDDKYNARMYHGPGYEKFPVVVGTVSEHQDACDEWDRVQAKVSTLRKQRQACRVELARYVNDTTDVDSNDEDEDENMESMRTALELECLHKVREVLPDIQRRFALKQVRDHIDTHVRNVADDVQIQPSPSLVVNQILELSDYPKQEKRAEAKEPAADGTGVTIEWQKGDIESKTYSRDAVCLLAGQFEYVPTHFISKVVQEKKSLYDSFFHLQDLETKYHTLSSKDRLYRRSHHPRLSLEKKYTAKENDFRPRDQWENLVNEMQAARQQTERDKLRTAKELEDQALEEANLQHYRSVGDLVECQCCFDDEVPMNRAVSCEDQDMHWFCFACVLRLAEDRVGSMKFEMTCMHQSGCKANLIREGVRCAIPQKLFDKLAFYQQQFEITAACIEGLEQCPFCDFKAICDPIEETVVFQCQNPDCRRVTCRKCHEDSHLPKTCEEFKNDKRISARHQVEEARSEAMMRPCPKCKVKIVKEMGCNKMRCSMCGCLMCYVCKMDISTRKDGGYGHFNEPGAKCVLYDKNFNRHEAEANEAEREAIKKVQAENGDIDEQQLQIETNKQAVNLTAHPNKPGPRAGQIAARNQLGGPINAFEAAVRQQQVEFEAAMRRHQGEFQAVFPRMAHARMAPPTRRRIEPLAAVNWPRHPEARDAQNDMAPFDPRPRPAGAMLDNVMELQRLLHPINGIQPGPMPTDFASQQLRAFEVLQRERALRRQPVGNQTQQQDVLPGNRLLPDQNRPWFNGVGQQAATRDTNGLNARNATALLLQHHRPHGAQAAAQPALQGAEKFEAFMPMQNRAAQGPFANNMGGLDGMLAPWHWPGLDMNDFVPAQNGNLGPQMNDWDQFMGVFPQPDHYVQAPEQQAAGQADANQIMPANSGDFNMRY